MKLDTRNISLDYARLHDYNEVLSLEQSIFPWLYTSYDTYKRNTELGDYFKIVYTPNEQERKVIGTFNYVPLGDIIVIRKLLILNQYRRQQVGTHVLNFLKENAEALKINIPKHHEARQFLDANGFVYDNDVHNYWKKNKVDAEIYIWRKNNA